jgi:internalin A
MKGIIEANRRIEDAKNTCSSVLLLHNLDLSECPDSVWHLTHLTVLDLSGNKLTALPDDLIKLKHLRALSVEDNQFSNVPLCIFQLKSLQQINLSKNKIRTVPVEVLNLTNLNKIMLAQNPIEQPPIEIASQGIKSIKNYFEAIYKEETVRVFEAKLLVVGQGEVGKTYLTNRLIHNEVNLETLSTEGIEIKKWIISSNIGTNFRINCWDFGGQEIYHSTHQFFLTKRSLYLFIWTARVDDDITSFDYWLNVIRLLSEESPVLVVMNKSDERIKSIDEKSIKDKFSNIVKFYRVSAKEGTNIPELSHDIKKTIKNLDHIGDVLPKTWQDIRMRIERFDKNYISYQEYEDMCIQFGLNKEKCSYLIRYFHDLGVVLHFEDSVILREIVFLKPDWATNAVYKINTSLRN